MSHKQKHLVSEQLRQAITATGQSLNQIAQHAGVDVGLLSRFMRSERGLTMTTVDKVANYLHLELRKSKQKGR